MIAAVIMPAHDSARAAILAALAAPRPAGFRLFTDGIRLIWMPRPPRGWFLLSAREKTQ